MKHYEVAKEWRYDYKNNSWHKDYEIITTAEDSLIGERIGEVLTIIAIVFLIITGCLYATGHEYTFDNGIRIEKVVK